MRTPLFRPRLGLALSSLACLVALSVMGAAGGPGAGTASASVQRPSAYDPVPPATVPAPSTTQTILAPDCWNTNTHPSAPAINQTMWASFLAQLGDAAACDPSYVWPRGYPAIYQPFPAHTAIDFHAGSYAVALGTTLYIDGKVPNQSSSTTDLLVTSIGGPAIIRRPSANLSPTVPFVPMITIRHTSRVKLEHLILDGEAATDTVVNGQHVLTPFSDIPDSEILPVSGSKPADCRSLPATSCKDAEMGLYIGSSRSEEMSGNSWYRTSNVWLTDVSVQNTLSDSVYMAYVTGVRIEDSSLLFTGRDSITTTTASDVMISNNQLGQAAAWALDIEPNRVVVDVNPDPQVSTLQQVQDTTARIEVSGNSIGSTNRADPSACSSAPPSVYCRGEGVGIGIVLQGNIASDLNVKDNVFPKSIQMRIDDGGCSQPLGSDQCKRGSLDRLSISGNASQATGSAAGFIMVGSWPYTTPQPNPLTVTHAWIAGNAFSPSPDSASHPNHINLYAFPNALASYPCDSGNPSANTQHAVDNTQGGSVNGVAPLPVEVNGPTACYAEAVGATLTQGSVLGTGERLVSPNGDYEMRVGWDGTWSIRNRSGVVQWSLASVVAPASIQLTATGRLAFTAPTSSSNHSRQVVWQSYASGSGMYLSMQNDGNLVLYDGNGEARWSSRYGFVNLLPRGGVLLPNQAIHSLSGSHYVAILQGDGNFVVYHDGVATWSSSTNTGAKLSVRSSDGKLAISSASGSTVWSKPSSTKSGDYLVMQTDGNLVLYAADGTPVWCSWYGDL